ncbi:DUF3324 domain-containing protein [Liquorilactobacillus ghanensis]
MVQTLVGHYPQFLQSKISYVIPVILQENEQIIHTKLNLEKVVAKSVVGEPVILAKIANLTPTYFGQLQLKAQVYTKNQHKKVLKQTNSNMEMAPLSYFNYHIQLKKTLAKGKYILVLKMNSGKRKWKTAMQKCRKISSKIDFLSSRIRLSVN